MSTLEPSPPSSEPPRGQIGLASWLGAGSVLIVLVAVVAIAVSSAVLLHQLVQQQAMVRTQLAAASAAELLRKFGEDALTAARVLTERSTLQRLVLDEGGNGGLQAYLARFAQTAGVDVAAVLRGNVVVAQSGADVDWPEIKTAIEEQGERFIVAPRNGGLLKWGASAAIAGTDEQVITLRTTTPSVLEHIAQEVGAQLTLTNFVTYHAPPDELLTPLHTVALAQGGKAVAGVFKDGDLYAASQPISAQTGEVVALLDASISGEEPRAAVHSFDWALAVVALLVSVLAGTVGVQYGRWLAKPVVALRDFAERIGRGDFSVAVPRVVPFEVSALARSMDAMRGNLLNLTEVLRRREAEAQAVLGGVVEGVFAVDMDRRIRYVNTQVTRLLNRSRSEILGQFCGDVLQPGLVNGERPCERACPILAARTQAQSDARETLRLPDGSLRSTIIRSAQPIHGVQVQILRDETDMEAARRARDSVLGNISHEFRTPLAAQLASIELLRDGIESMPGDAQRELIANVERGVLRLMRLIDNLLESVRIEAGQLSIRQQPVEISELLVEAGDLMAPLLRQRQLHMEVQLPAESFTALGDAPRLSQVFVNLLANATKFSPEGSTIHVGGRHAGTQIEIWVEDEGPGIPDGASATVFERFQRGSQSEPDAPGLGLGLWIVKSIIERHGGTIQVARTAEQRTRFTLVLPAYHETED